ncbi:MAG TPA: hypothetical protein VFW75_02650 [Acetobacteraceae bacterium]|nr:hypothetical protein [Acetobacteraceae bacterium]
MSIANAIGIIPLGIESAELRLHAVIASAAEQSPARMRSLRAQRSNLPPGWEIASSLRSSQ